MASARADHRVRLVGRRASGGDGARPSPTSPPASRFPASTSSRRIRDTYLDEKLRLTDAEIAALSPLRLPAVPKPLAIAYGTAELPALVEDSRDLHAQRAAAHAPGPLLPIAGANHFTILEELRRPDGKLVRAALDLVG